ncbi:MAG: hypothetical protein A3G87_02895 [Omnitrophica bacterium RIFCSPLOWO2_12_FULL_50_11]|nr:MAG: hypothetical protein A3G87_02895 [Omnitrophica bacterium RIFCSPLOWO2_12_FULL_50_11]
MRSVGFPYVRHRGYFVPIIPFQIHFPKAWGTLFAYVDTGASFTIIRSSDAQVFGYDFTKGKKMMVTVGDGGLIPVYLTRLPVRIGHFEFLATIGFSLKLGVTFNLLGRASVFDRFDVTFSDRRRKLIFTPAARNRS